MATPQHGRIAQSFKLKFFFYMLEGATTGVHEYMTHDCPVLPRHPFTYAVLCCLLQELETLLWAVCRLEHRADELVAEMAAEVSRALIPEDAGVFSFFFVLVAREGSMCLIESQMSF